MAPVLTAAFLAAAALSSSFDDTQTVKLTLTPNGVARQFGYMPQRATLTDKKPDTIKKLPEELAAPVFAIIPTAGREGAVFHVVLDEPEGGTARAWIDANGDGDLTNDPSIEWDTKTSENRGVSQTMSSGSTKLNLGTAQKPYEVGINLYRFDKDDPKREALKDTLLFYRDYATEGELKLGDTTYKVMLVDELVTGDFRGKTLTDDPKSMSGVQLMIDRDGDGKFGGRGERYDVRKPFNIAGTSYELANIAKNGLSFAVKKSDIVAEEVKAAPDHKVGKNITAFEAKTMGGKSVKFPSDYKGRVVLLDFWATWCPPCIKEMPHVVKAYKQFHDKGFEVLGISLDREKAEDAIKKMAGDQGMAWPQIYDGKFWDARLAQLYVIEGIPATFLVDGDTGKIIGTNLRGDALSEAVEKALEQKKPQ